MDLQRTSRFNFGSSLSAQSRAFFSGLQPVKTADQIKLDYLCTALGKGIQDVYEVAGLDCALEFAPITEQILNKLIEINDSTSIEINTKDFILRLQETGDAIFILVNSAKDFLFNMTFEELTQAIIRNIVSFPYYFSSPSINYALHHLFITSLDNELKTRGACYVAKTSPHHISHDRQQLIFLAASHLFLHQQNYQEKNVKKLAALAVKSANHCQRLKLLEAAQYILRNQEAYHLTFIKSASLLILVTQERCNDELLKLATDYIASNPTNYPQQFLIETALAFIKTHWNFFRTPLKSSQTQHDFVAFFQEKGVIESLANYSHALGELLHSSDLRLKKKFTIEEWDEAQKQKVMKTLSIQGMWIDGYFRRVLEVNSAIAIFILQNMRHEAIKIWNSPDNKLAHSTQFG